MAEKAIKQPDVFIWTGTDKRGVKVKPALRLLLPCGKRRQCRNNLAAGGQ